MEITALVTGASSGIGREFSKQLAAQNVALVLTSRNEEKLTHLKVEIEQAYAHNAEIIPIDLSVPGNAISLYKECERRGLDIDILINNAGAGMFGESIAQDSVRIESLLILNMISLTTLSSKFAAKMKLKGSGHILNVGSFAGNQATPYFASYAASKRYVHDFSLALRAELKSAGVNVTCLVPGFVSTDFDSNAGIENSRYLSFSKRGALPASKVAEIGLKAMFRKKARVTAGVVNKAVAVVAGLIPPKVKAAVIRSGVGWISR